MAKQANKSPEQLEPARGKDPDDWLVAEAHADKIISGRRKPESAESVETLEPELQQSGGRSPIRDETTKRILKRHPQRELPKA